MLGRTRHAQAATGIVCLVCLVCASCGVLLGLDDTPDDPIGSDAGAPTGDGGKGDRVEADGQSNLDAGGEDDAAAPGCPAGSVAMDSGCLVTKEPTCGGPVVIPPQGGIFSGTICANESTASALCNGLSLPTHVFELTGSGTVLVTISAPDAFQYNRLTPACVPVGGSGCGAGAGPAAWDVGGLERPTLWGIAMPSDAGCTTYVITVKP